MTGHPSHSEMYDPLAIDIMPKDPRLALQTSLAESVRMSSLTYARIPEATATMLAWLPEDVRAAYEDTDDLAAAMDAMRETAAHLISAQHDPSPAGLNPDQAQFLRAYLAVPPDIELSPVQLAQRYYQRQALLTRLTQLATRDIMRGSSQEASNLGSGY